jgi:hypothetical protein
MRVQTKVVVIFATLLVSAGLSGCGSAKHQTTTSASIPTTTSPHIVKPTFGAHFSALNHHPVVNENWPVKLKVTDRAGKPVAATLRMQVLLGTVVEGPVDNGAVHRFVGKYHEFITWPLASKGINLTLQAIVTVGGVTKKFNWPITVVAK